MQILATSILVGSLLFAGAIPEAFAQPSATTVTAAPVQPADSTGDHGTYLQQTKAEMLDWQIKLDRFGEKARTNGQEAARATERDLKAAWAETEVDADKLRVAGADGWDRAKIGYEKSVLALTTEWDKIRAEDK